MRITRRDFLKKSTVTGLEGLLACSPLGGLVWAGRPPDLVVARDRDPGAAVSRAIGAFGGIERFVSPGDRVIIKPNMAWDRKPEQAATTNPRIVASVVRLCFGARARSVSVMDNPCDDPRRVYVQSGIAKAAREAGAKTPFMDSRKFTKTRLKGEVLSEWEVYRDILEADKVINIPIAKHHSLAGLTLSMKNWMGAIGGMRSQLHWKLDESLVDLAGFFKPCLTILDCVRVLTANGPQGGRLDYVKTLNTVVVGTDQVAVDTLGVRLFENITPRQASVKRALRTIQKAADRGIGRMDLDRLKIVRLDQV